MPSRKATGLYAYYWLLDSTGAPVVESPALHTLKWDKDGTPATPSGTPVQCLVGATATGEYKVPLSGGTSGETDCNGGKIIGVSSTSAAYKVIGSPIFFEQLPTVSAGEVGGLGLGNFPPAVIVSGTCSPDVTGVYAVNLGSPVSGFPLLQHVSDNTKRIVYTGSGIFEIQISTVGKFQLFNYSPIGIATGTGGSTGSPVVELAPTTSENATATNVILSAAHGSALWGPAGLNTVTKTVHVQDALGNAVAGADVYTTSDQQGTARVSGPFPSDASGDATCYFPRGTQWMWWMLAGHPLSAPVQITV